MIRKYRKLSVLDEQSHFANWHISMGSTAAHQWPEGTEFKTASARFFENPSVHEKGNVVLSAKPGG